MIGAFFQIHHFQCVQRAHRIIRDLGDQLNIFARRQARNQIVKLKNKPDIFASVAGQIGWVTGSQFTVEVMHGTGRGHIQPAKDIQQG